MSSDTAKEDASVVDSSATEWKQDMESPSYKGSQNGEPCREKDTREIRERGRLCDTRYFIIKSLNHQNIQLSYEKGIWATQLMNEPILEEAFHNSGRVILIFSVNMSGFFQGYAQMISTVGWRRDNVWSQGNGKCNPWGRSFKVKWLRLNDLPFQRTLHLKNPLNDYKPVKISRDCQELSPDIGEALCELIDGQSNVDGLQMMRPYAEAPCSLGHEDYNMPPGHPSWSQSQAHMPYSSLAYQQQSEAMGYQYPYGRANGADFSENFNVNSAASKESPLASVLTDDDFLEMSYEEYLEAHSRSSRQFCRQASSGPPQMKQDSARSKRHSEDQNSSFESDRSGSRKRAHSSSRQQL